MIYGTIMYISHKLNIQPSLTHYSNSHTPTPIKFSPNSIKLLLNDYTCNFCYEDNVYNTALTWPKAIYSEITLNRLNMVCRVAYLISSTATKLHVLSTEWQQRTIWRRCWPHHMIIALHCCQNHLNNINILPSYSKIENEKYPYNDENIHINIKFIYPEKSCIHNTTRILVISIILLVLDLQFAKLLFVSSCQDQ